MATVTVLNNCAIYFGQANVSGQSNMVRLSSDAAVLDKTTFGSNGWREVTGGLKNVVADTAGFVNASADNDGTAIDDKVFGDLGTTGVPASFIPAGGADGDSPAYFMSAFRASYQRGAAVGELLGFNTQAMGDGQPLVRGTVMHAASADRTTSGTGTARQLGAVSATQRLYAALHLFSLAGTATPTLTVIVQSDNGVGMSTPVTAASFTARTTIGSQFISAAGPITDDYYRVSYTISGTNPHFFFAVLIGIA